MMISVLILLTSIPVGYLLAHLCRDELVPGRKWFLLLMIISLILSWVLFFAYLKLEIILTLIYIFITSLISFILSYDRGFIRKR